MLVEDLKREFNALFALTYRDLKSFFNNKARLIINIGLPLMLMWVVGKSVQLNLGANVGFDYLYFIFTGVIGQTMFQSTAINVITIIEDRKSGLSQEIFVAPISRFTIIMSKILAETIISSIILTAIFLFGLYLEVYIPFWKILLLLPVCILVALIGGAFGILILSNVRDIKTANQINTILIGPQFFLAGVFTPIKQLSPLLFLASRISPMTYVIDLIRGITYWGHPDYNATVLYNPFLNLFILNILFILFFTLGTIMFTNAEKKK